MKKLMLIGIVGTFLMTACIGTGVGINIGTSIIPGVYIGTSVPLSKATTSKKEKTVKQEKFQDELASTEEEK